MWLVADNRDPKAIADFELRFPELKAELAKHMAMVSGLRTAGKQAPPHNIPRFVPRYAHVQRRPTGLYVALAFVLGAMAFGSYAGYTVLSSPKRVKPNVAVHVDTFARKEPERKPVSVQPENKQNSVEPEQQQPEKEASAPEDRVSNDYNDPLMKLVSFDVESAPLKAAILMVCKAAGVTADIPIELENADTSLQCRDMPAIDILQELGEAHGFSVFPQETGKVLIVPGRPTTSKPDPNEQIPRDPNKVQPTIPDQDR
jgi:hypothetical protein